MNIIVTNKYRDLINNANIEIMKELSGVFDINQLVNSFNSIFYKKLIIDATALNRFPKDEVLRNLVKSFDPEKLILFLPPDNPPPKKFLSFLVSINLYNFTDNINGLTRLVNNSNTYNDVKNFLEEEIVVHGMNESLDFSQNTLNIENGKIVLGIKNVTQDAGSTELVYLLKKNLEEKHNKKVIAVEIDKRDFMFYNSRDMYSISSDKVDEFFSLVGKSEIVLIDLDNDKYKELCSDIIYLVDPSLYRINQLMMGNKNAFNALRGKKVIFNNSLLSDKDCNLFSKEAGISVYFNLPPLNDRIYNPIIDELLSKLGLIEEVNNDTKKGLFDIFK
ncbi:MAG: hypothetical protein IJ501_00215 [Bacilli bacterium]|nr:hypothetical protein [Bacilli bacterium]